MPSKSCPKCGSPPNVVHTTGEGDTQCLACSYTFGTPLPCDECNCRDGCTGHTGLLKLGNGPRTRTTCPTCRRTQRSELPAKLRTG